MDWAAKAWRSAAASSSGFPLYTPANGPYTSPFGWRTNPVLGYSELHDGLDIGAGCNTPVYAAASGTVGRALAVLLPAAELVQFAVETMGREYGGRV